MMMIQQTTSSTNLVQMALRQEGGHWGRREGTEAGGRALRQEGGHWGRREGTGAGGRALRQEGGHWGRREVRSYFAFFRDCKRTIYQIQADSNDVVTKFM